MLAQEVLPFRAGPVQKRRYSEGAVRGGRCTEAPTEEDRLRALCLVPPRSALALLARLHPLHPLYQLETEQTPQVLGDTEGKEECLPVAVAKAAATAAAVAYRQARAAADLAAEEMQAATEKVEAERVAAVKAEGAQATQDDHACITLLLKMRADTGTRCHQASPNAPTSLTASASSCGERSITGQGHAAGGWSVCDRLGSPISHSLVGGSETDGRMVGRTGGQIDGPEPDPLLSRIANSNGPQPASPRTRLWEEYKEARSEELEETCAGLHSPP